ncbi:hypothetical protein [Bacteroides acidifaciens]|uniref:hypothetical protein n=2 Tax=Bacteroides acidifaciens TaxID=85831 RepID=UPI0025759674|nr:hypothetical protein [Bacteroides acidifaciens]
MEMSKKHLNIIQNALLLYDKTIESDIEACKHSGMSDWAKSESIKALGCKQAEVLTLIEMIEILNNNN